MSFTDDTRTHEGPWINWHVMMLAAGLAVGISAAAIAGVFDREVTPAASAVNPPAAPPPAEAIVAGTAPSAAELVYFIVGSQQEAAAVNEAMKYSFPSEGAGTRTHHVFVVDTAEREAKVFAEINAVQQEIVFTEGFLTVHDLRHAAAPGARPASLGADAGAVAQPTRPVVYIVGSEAEASALASGASGELAEHGEGLSANYSIVVIDGPEKDHVYNTIVGQQMEGGAFDLVDLRR